MPAGHLRARPAQAASGQSAGLPHGRQGQLPGRPSDRRRAGVDRPGDHGLDPAKQILPGPRHPLLVYRAWCAPVPRRRAGLPTVDNTHEIAQRVAPGTRVVYADNDPLVMTHARALLTNSRNGTCGHVTADIRDPADLIAGAAATLDFTQPAAVLMVNVLNYI